MVLPYTLKHGQQGSQFAAPAEEHPEQRLEDALDAMSEHLVSTGRRFQGV
jgi:hypothetical protein